MARKRKQLQHLSYESSEYWNRLLVEEGLSVETGRDPRLIYIGGSTEIEALEGAISTNDGRTPVDGDEN